MGGRGTKICIPETVDTYVTLQITGYTNHSQIYFEFLTSMHMREGQSHPWLSSAFFIKKCIFVMTLT